MFPPAPVPVPLTSFSATFKPASSEEEEDDDTLGAVGVSADLRPALPLLPSCQLLCPSQRLHYGIRQPGNAQWGILCHSRQPRRLWPGAHNDELDLGIEADDEANGDKEAAKDAMEEPNVNPEEMELLKTITKKAPTSDQPSTIPKSGNKQGLTTSTVALWLVRLIC